MIPQKLKEILLKNFPILKKLDEKTLNDIYTQVKNKKESWENEDKSDQK